MCGFSQQPLVVCVLLANHIGAAFSACWQTVSKRRIAFAELQSQIQWLFSDDNVPFVSFLK